MPNDDRYHDDERDERGTRRERHSDTDRSRDDERRDPLYPQKLRTAGYIWFIFGIIILVSGGVNLAMGQMNQGNDAAVAGGACGVIIVALLGGVFIHVGLQSIKGTARDTLGNAIGSLIIALLIGGYSILMLKAALILPVFYVFAIIGFTEFAALLIAGVLAIMAREDFQDWKRSNKGERQRADSYFDRRDDRARRDDRDDEDERQR